MISPKITPPYDYNFVLGDLAFIGVPKCGSATVRESVFGKGAGVSRESVLNVKHRMTVIRHPLARIVSAWRYGWAGVPFEEWWCHVKHNPRFDIHTFPYTEWLGEDFTEVHCLEFIGEWWPTFHNRFPQIVPAQPLHVNLSRHPYSGDWVEFEAEIEEVYHEDLRFWSSVSSRASIYPKTI